MQQPVHQTGSILRVYPGMNNAPTVEFCMFARILQHISTVASSVNTENSNHSKRQHLPRMACHGKPIMKDFTSSIIQFIRSW